MRGPRRADIVRSGESRYSECGVRGESGYSECRVRESGYSGCRIRGERI
ncbi:unnamed protein product [Staurois parvus]|uniref:Uncharacterized protein n=1 Tax=Staurois parvus TaxID=386267 RepID=A0ABN9HBC2_9NEOB|nr:unnamed protein product [Staurois parvus]